MTASKMVVRGELSISYFTDPLCAWSWAFEREWQKVKEALGRQACVSYHMGGLIPDWTSFRDTINSVTRPLQMGPVWMHIAEITGAKIDPGIWMRDPPTSSYPPCIAFHCAALQSPEAAHLYLGILREAAMLFSLNISKTDVLLSLAANPVMDLVGFNQAKFKSDLFGGAGLPGFRHDLQLTQNHRITRFPSLIIRRKNKPALLVAGFKRADELMRTIDS